MRAELADFAREIAGHAATYLSAVGEIATGTAPQTAISELTVQLAQVSMAGAMLGAVRDVVPAERFETDTGPDPDLDPLRGALANLLEGIDDYAAIFDPLLPTEPSLGRISDDIADVAGDLSHGLRHYSERPPRRGPVVVAVLLPVELGTARALRPPRAALDRVPPATRRRRGGRHGRRGRRPPARLTPLCFG